MNDFETTKQVSPLTNSELAREALKPCPFCGGAAKVSISRDDIVNIRCENWGQSCMGAGKNIDSDDAPIEQAAKAWNTRAALSTEAHYEEQPDGTTPLCECRSWVRMEGYDPNFPGSWHHHRCQHFKQRAFIKLTLNGKSCVMEPNEAAMALVNDGAGTEDKYLVEGILLTQDQFENLGDFNGF